MSFPDDNSPVSSDIDLEFNDEKVTTFIVGIAGGTSSGKTEVCDLIVKSVKHGIGKEKETNIVRISQESFYRELTREEQKQAENGIFDFDHPNAIDFDLMMHTLSSIKNRKPAEIPVYDFKKNARVKDKSLLIQPSDVILFEGILSFYRKDVLDLFDLRLYVDCDADLRLSKRIIHDTELGRNINHILDQYNRFVKPAFDEFCSPTKKYADIIIPRGADNEIAISVVSQRIISIVLNNIKPLSH